MPYLKVIVVVTAGSGIAAQQEVTVEEQFLALGELMIKHIYKG